MKTKDEVLNLITNMVIREATEEEMTRAIKYSMMVINTDKSYVDNNIEELNAKFNL